MLRSAACIGVLFVLCTTAYGLSKRDYNRNAWRNGDGTYYGLGGEQTGNCAMRAPRPPWMAQRVPVAVSGQIYEGMCGACVIFYGEGKGAGANPIRGWGHGVVVDKCPECKPGDLDLSRIGDGRWHIKWRVVPCPGPGAGGLGYLFEGSNRFYRKLQPRNLMSPAYKVRIDGVPARFTDDNFWVAQKYGGGFSHTYKVQIWTILGHYYESMLDEYTDGVHFPLFDRFGQKFVRGIKRQRRRFARRPRPRPAPRRPKRPACAANWTKCSGKCCGGWRCVRSRLRWWKGRRCEPPRKPRRVRPAKCARKWTKCSWRVRCCGGWRCVRPKNHRYWVGRRCEPPRKRPRGGKCRAMWTRCGDIGKWTTWSGRKYPGKRCCARGSTCRRAKNWNAFRGWRCEPW